MLPSASELTRVLTCEDSELLSPVIIAESTVDSRHGTTMHDFIYRIGREGTSREESLEAISDDDPDKAACEAFDTTALPVGGHFEVALAWNFRTSTGRVLGYNLKRDYGAADRAKEYVGSFDYAAGISPVHGVLADWKSGWRTIPPKDSWQILGGAVFAADTWGWTEVTGAHLDMRNPERPRWDIVHLDELALSAARSRLQAYGYGLQARQERIPGKFVEGEHCRWCRGYKVCPAKTAHIRGLVGGLQPLPPPGEVTPAMLRQAVIQIERYDEARDRAWNEIEAWARMAPIDLGDGRTLRVAPGRPADKVLDVGRAIEEVGEILGEAYAHKAVTTSKGAIEAAASAYAKDNGLLVGKTKELVIETLRRKGVIEKQPGKEDVRIVEDK